MTEIVEGYKATDKNMQCRGYQFELGTWHKHDGELAMCDSGFHFCEYPSGPWAFYWDNGTRIFRVEARGILKGEGPGADLKHVALEIRLVEEITPGGHSNTGHRNTGDRNTGDRNTGHRNTGDRNTGHSNTGNSNTGDWNTGDSNTGHRNTGDCNTGDRNTGDRNTGDRNTGDRNTGDRNTGHRNTGDRNTGDGCVGNRHSGFFCIKKQPVIFFDEPVVEDNFNRSLVRRLAHELSKDDPFDPTPYLSLPNATEEKIKVVHAAHIEARKNRR